MTTARDYEFIRMQADKVTASYVAPNMRGRDTIYEWLFLIDLLDRCGLADQVSRAKMIVTDAQRGFAAQTDEILWLGDLCSMLRTAEQSARC